MRAALLVAALLLAHDARADEAEPAEAAWRVESIELVGAFDFEDELTARLVTADRGWRLWRDRPVFDEATLEDDVDRALRFHRSEGYYEATVAAEVERDQATRRVRIRLVIERGEATRLRRFGLEWSPASPARPAPLDTLAADLPLRVGERFGARRYEEARTALLEALAEAGHPLASLEGGAQVILEDGAADVDWRIDAGPAVTLGEITVVGLDQAREVVVQRRLTLESGDTWSPRALRENERAIYATGLFRSVAVRPLRPEPSEGAAERAEGVTWPIEIRVDERERRSIRVGGGWGTEDRFRARGEWHHRNLFGEAESLDVQGRYSSLIAGGEARYRDPSVFDPDYVLEVPLGFERETEPGYDVNRTYVAAELSRRRFTYWRFSGGYRFEYANPTDIDSDPFANDDDSVLLGTLLLRARRRDVDDLFEPTHGSVFELDVLPTLSALGSDLDSIEIVGRARWYRSWRGIVLALRADLGTIEPVAGTSASDIPVFLRFFSGGSASVRGYDRHRLGPLDDDGDPLGGLSFAEASAEVRFPIWRALGGVFFFDAGQVRARPHDWSTDDISTAWGGGIRIATPVGPLRLDIGVPLDDRPTTESYELHLSVGHAF